MVDRPRQTTDPSSRRWRRGLPLGLVAVGGLAFVLWLVLLAPRLLVPSAPTDSLSDVPDPAKRHELQDNRLKLQNDDRTTLLQGLGGLAVLIDRTYAVGRR
jgi:hypothetical protein